MPYLHARISMKESAGVADQVVSSLMKHTSEILGKKPEVTAISIDFVSPGLWFIGGARVETTQNTTFYLDIKITEGTNTKAEKAMYVKEVFNDMGAIIGPLASASYIVIDDVRGDSWGFEGKTQEYRFIKSLPL